MSRKLTMNFCVALFAIFLAASSALADDSDGRTFLDPRVTAIVEWGVWIDRDGCMHWWADGGSEGYMVPRRDPKTGKPVCLKRETCFESKSDVLFDTAQAVIRPTEGRKIRDFFEKDSSFSYAIYGYTDDRGAYERNLKLSQARAKAVADIARSTGAVVERELGFGEDQPIADNKTEPGRAQNRRVEVVCYRW